MMLSEKTLKSWRIDFGEKVTSSAEAMLNQTPISIFTRSFYVINPIKMIYSSVPNNRALRINV